MRLDVEQDDGKIQSDKPQQQGKVYASRAEEKVQDYLSYPYYSCHCIVDSGSTHTFIAITFIDRLGVSI